GCAVGTTSSRRCRGRWHAGLVSGLKAARRNSSRALSPNLISKRSTNGANGAQHTKQVGRIIFEKIRLSLWFFFTKTLSLLTALLRSAFWNFYNCRFRPVWKSHHQPLKSKPLESPRSGQKGISSSKERRPTGLLESSSECTSKDSRNRAEPPKNHLVALPLKTNARRITRTQTTAVALPQMSQTGR